MANKILTAFKDSSVVLKLRFLTNNVVSLSGISSSMVSSLISLWLPISLLMSLIATFFDVSSLISTCLELLLLTVLSSVSISSTFSDFADLTKIFSGAHSKYSGADLNCE